MSCSFEIKIMGLGTDPTHGSLHLAGEFGSLAMAAATQSFLGSLGSNT
jgi:hypothetical protein